MKERLEVEAKLRQCKAIRTALGDGFDDGAVGAFPIRATCGGTNEQFWAAAVLDPKGEAFRISHDDDETDRESEQLLQWGERRTAMLRLRWPCPDPPT